MTASGLPNAQAIRVWMSVFMISSMDLKLGKIKRIQLGRIFGNHRRCRSLNAASTAAKRCAIDDSAISTILLPP